MMRKLSFCLWRGLRDDEVSGMKDWRCMTYGVHNLHWTDSPCSIWLNWPQSRETQGWNGEQKMEIQYASRVFFPPICR